MPDHRRVVAVISYNDVNTSEAFYGLLGFRRAKNAADYGDYVMPSDHGGAEIHLTKVPDGWMVPGRNSYGIYFHAENVEEPASRLEGRLIHPPMQQPWGVFEFTVSDPDKNLVRVGRGISCHHDHCRPTF